MYIYVLTDNPEGKVRYVGQTNNLGRRLNKHMSDARSGKNKRHISNWLRSLSNPPIMIVVEVCDYSVKDEREEYWINYYKEMGCDLCNSSKGGSGPGICNKNAKGNKGGGNPKRIYQYDKNNNLIAVYESIQEATKTTGFNRTTIRRNIQGISSSRSFIWTDKPAHNSEV